MIGLTMLAAEAATGTGNALTGHPSPYLAMHGQDPVGWRDWGREALEQARARGLPLFVSSGYFACHWCHVMQRESYRNSDIAELLNSRFVPVKIDRELNPALDEYLIGFTERTSGRAGWPLNVVLTPDGFPLVGFTYLPPDELEAVLQRVIRLWGDQRDRVVEMARAGAQEYAALLRPDTSPLDPVDWPDFDALLMQQAMAFADPLAGGFGPQTRFPREPQMSALIDLYARNGDGQLGGFLRLTLDAMADGALRDHLGGGFFRYTVDPDWQTPHFEKMLYNQAQLVPLYLRAAEVLGEPRYRVLARETLDFMLSTLAGEDGGYIGSLSAVDAAGVEGGFYLWDEATLERLLEPAERRLAALVWGLEGAPRFEAGHLPIPRGAVEEAAADIGVPASEAEAMLERVRGRLLEARAARDLPRDHKQLAGWNGLALSAIAAGVAAFGEDRYREAGAGLRRFLTERLWDGERLHRARSPSGWFGTASVEDYAYVAAGLADWGKAAGDEGARSLAHRLVGLAWSSFRDGDGWRRDSAPLLPAVPAEPALSDGALPSPAALLTALALAHPDTAVRASATAAQRVAAPLVVRDTFNFASDARLLGEAGAPGP